MTREAPPLTAVQRREWPRYCLGMSLVPPRNARQPLQIPPPPAGLTAAKPGDWIPLWRRVVVDPKADIKPWDGIGEPVCVTAGFKSAVLWAATWADFEDGTRVFPGLLLLAEVTGWTERTVGHALDTAARLGFLWRYVDGSRHGRPVKGEAARASEYRLTVPDDLLGGRIPLLKRDLPEDHPNSDHPNSDHLNSDQVISVHGSGELSARISRTQFAPPRHRPSQKDPLSVPGANLHAALAAVVSDVTPRETELIRATIAKRPGVISAGAVMRTEIADGNGPALVAQIRAREHLVGDADRRPSAVSFRDCCSWCSQPGHERPDCPEAKAAASEEAATNGSPPGPESPQEPQQGTPSEDIPVIGRCCRYDACRTPAVPVEPGSDYHSACGHLAHVKASRRPGGPDGGRAA